MLSGPRFFGMVMLVFVLASVGCSAQEDSVSAGSGERTSASIHASRPEANDDVAASCNPEGDTAGYMGIYEIVSADRYGGSLSSENEARGRIGQKVELLPESFESAWNKASIPNPQYATSCYPVSREEGEVAAVHWGGHWSNFYGFGADREVVSVLEIHDPNDTGREPGYWYEIVPVNGKVQLWNMYDGWLYKMTKTR